MEQIDISIRTGAMIANSTAAAPRMPSGSPLTSRRTALAVFDKQQSHEPPPPPRHCQSHSFDKRRLRDADRFRPHSGAVDRELGVTGEGDGVSDELRASLADVGAAGE